MEISSAYSECLNRLVNATYGICISDTARRLLFWNDAAERISEYRRDEIVGHLCYENILCHTDEQGRELCSGDCPLKRAMESGRTVGPEVLYLRHKGGRKVPVEIAVAPVFSESGEVVGGIQLFHDITQLMEKERALQIKSQKLEIVIENIREAVLFIDGSGRISVYNNAVSEMFSLGHDDLSGTNIFSLPDSHALRQGIFRADKGFKGPYCWELYRCPEERADCPEHATRYCRCWIFSRYRITSPPSTTCIDCSSYRGVKRFLEQPKELDLGQRSISVASSFIEVRERNEIWEVIVFRDVTAEKTDAVIKLAGGAAHELRQPMQALVSAVSVLKRDALTAETMAQCLEIIRESCVRMDKLVRQLGETAKYRLKPYVGQANILDLDQSAREEELQ
jgi:PAS domain S-box-containing protein